MAILYSWQTFRHYFAPKVITTGSYTFVASSPPTITQAAGDFSADGFLAGHSLDVAYTVNNNTRFTIDSVAALTLTLDASDSVTAEGPVTAELLGVYRNADGAEEFPSEFGSTSLIRSAGFDGGLEDFPGIYGAVMAVSVNSYAADATYNVDEYNWYLSQRTDDPALQYLVMIPYVGLTSPGSPPDSYSGSMKIYPSNLAKSELGFTGPTDISTSMIREIFKYTYLYVQRISDGAIQWFDLHNIVVNP